MVILVDHFVIISTSGHIGGIIWPFRKSLSRCWSFLLPDLQLHSSTPSLHSSWVISSSSSSFASSPWHQHYHHDYHVNDHWSWSSLCYNGLIVKSKPAIVGNEDTRDDVHLPLSPVLIVLVIILHLSIISINISKHASNHPHFSPDTTRLLLLLLPSHGICLHTWFSRLLL